LHIRKIRSQRSLYILIPSIISLMHDQKSSLPFYSHRPVTLFLHRFRHFDFPILIFFGPFFRICKMRITSKGKYALVRGTYVCKVWSASTPLQYTYTQLLWIPDISFSIAILRVCAMLFFYEWEKVVTSYGEMHAVLYAQVWYEYTHTHTHLQSQTSSCCATYMIRAFSRHQISVDCLPMPSVNVSGVCGEWRRHAHTLDLCFVLFETASTRKEGCGSHCRDQGMGVLLPVIIATRLLTSVMAKMTT
jgi:hypothetical protein